MSRFAGVDFVEATIFLDFEEAVGKEADFVVIDCAASPLTERRLAQSADIAEKLFALIMLGDDRNIAETWLMGKCTRSRP